MVNPLSAIMESFSWNGESNNLLLTTISLSEMLPLYNWLIIEKCQPFQGCVVFVVTK